MSELRRCGFACSLFVDEGGHFRNRYAQPHPLSQWIEWPNGTWVLYSENRSSPCEGTSA